MTTSTTRTVDTIDGSTRPDSTRISIVSAALNEALGRETVLPTAPYVYEVILVDEGSAAGAFDAFAPSPSLTDRR